MVKIERLGSEILRRTCKPVEIGSHLKPVIADLQFALDRFRAENGFGRAIAAPQVGHSVQAIGMNLGSGHFTLFNPEITRKSDETFHLWDDCLSFPDLMVRVQRHKHIDVAFMNENGEMERWENVEQSISELLQHEIDHLSGVLAVDRAVDHSECPGIIFRNHWEENKEHYSQFVDYEISPTT